jgi:hypothetical protein
MFFENPKGASMHWLKRVNTPKMNEHQFDFLQSSQAG